MDDLKKELEVDIHKIPLEDAFRRFGVNRATGLTSHQAKAGNEKHGLNCLTPPPTVCLFAYIFIQCYNIIFTEIQKILI